MTRRNFPKSVMVARFQQCGGKCEGMLSNGKHCNAVLVPGRWRCDHHTPDALGGEPTLDNARCLCLQCDGRKTPNDQTYIAESNRRKAKAIGVPWPKPIIRNRGFAKVEKPKCEPRPHLPPRQLYQ